MRPLVWTLQGVQGLVPEGQCLKQITLTPGLSAEPWPGARTGLLLQISPTTVSDNPGHTSSVGHGSTERARLLAMTWQTCLSITQKTVRTSRRRGQPSISHHRPWKRSRKNVSFVRETTCLCILMGNKQRERRPAMQGKHTKELAGSLYRVETSKLAWLRQPGRLVLILFALERSNVFCFLH